MGNLDQKSVQIDCMPRTILLRAIALTCPLALNPAVVGEFPDPRCFLLL